MIINDDQKIETIQKEFQSKFEFLKLEFYKKPHATGEGNSNKEMLNPQQKIGDIRSNHNTGNLVIHGDMTVNELEKELYRRYDLNVQVFRLSGNLWLQTTATDEWTLKKQNEEGTPVTFNN